MSFTTLLLSLLSFTSTLVSAVGTVADATFIYKGLDNTQFVFALNADKSNGDLYFHMSSPTGYSWIGVGIGSQMKDSLMFIAYPDGDHNGVTISPRIASGHVEPTYQPNIDIQKQNSLPNANTVQGSRETLTLTADGVCRNCTSWNGGSIDLESTAQQFIFAVGPIFPPVASDSLSAQIQPHAFYGHFTMNVKQATSTGGGRVPPGPYTQDGASQASNTQYYSDPAPHIHGAVMSVVFVLLMPLSSLLLRVWNSVKGHAITNTIALVLFCMAFAGGCYISTTFNNTKNFNNAHQIIGILLLIALFSQLTMGILNHRIFKRESRTTIMGKIHKFLGPAIIVIGLFNGILGFALAGTTFIAIPYVIIILLVTGVYVCIRGGAWFRRRKRDASKQRGPEGYQYPQFGGPLNNNENTSYGYNQGHESGAFAQPPPPYGRDDVPLATYNSNNNSQQRMPHYNYDGPAAQPRPMV